MYTLGRFLGYVITFGYLLTILNYFVKWLNRTVMAKRPKDDSARMAYTRFMRFIVSNHRVFAIITSTALIAHFLIQSQSWGLYPTGIIAGSLLLVQGSLGGFGTYVKKKKPGVWLMVHRVVAILLGLAIVLHVLTARFS
ncbi:MAG: hypothetical protein EOM08_01095, partial [Clostridia bacterium]|nr:hypothetical protein [Clostridia bacterium]NCC75011.1 hypothetical protein [Clostridia bacterium]